MNKRQAKKFNKKLQIKQDQKHNQRIQIYGSNYDKDMVDSYEYTMKYIRKAERNGLIAEIKWDYKTYQDVIGKDIKKGVEAGQFKDKKEGLNYWKDKAFRETFNNYSDGEKEIQVYSKNQAAKFIKLAEKNGLIYKGQVSVTDVMTGKINMENLLHEYAKENQYLDIDGLVNWSLINQYFWGSN